MATLQQALTRIDAICPNAWDETAKLLWLNECESMIQTRILGTAPEQCITYDADTDRSTKLLVPAPFDRLYVYYVIAMCDYAAHETAHYADSMMLFNAALDEYAKWYQRTNGATASTPGLVKEIAANTKARHTHKNLAVLDGITAGKMAAWNAKADKAAATQKSDGLMSAADKRKLDTVEAHAKDVDVDDTLSPVSTAAIMNKTVTAALNAKAGTAAATTSANGLMSSADKVKLDGVEDGATKTIVDDAMSDTSTNPVQNKAVKAALDGKLSTQGGEILGHLSVGLTVSAEGSVSTGRTSTDTGIHFEKAGSDVGRISHGSDPMTGVSPIARLKVASPTEDDDAATKAYVDGRAVRYDAAQTLDEAQQFQARKNIGAVGNDSPQFQGYVTLTPANGTLGHGVGLSPSGSGYDYTLDISEVDTSKPTKLTGVKTPTDADTNAAATVEYVKAKVASGGGVTVDTAMSDTSTNPVQNKTIKQYVDDAVSLPLTLTYASGQATGASYSDIRKAIESGRQIKLSVANMPDIIVANAKNETDKSVLKFIHTDVGGDTVNIAQYTVTAQASGLTVNVKSHEIA